MWAVTALDRLPLHAREQLKPKPGSSAPFGKGRGITAVLSDGDGVDSAYHDWSA